MKFFERFKKKQPLSQFYEIYKDKSGNRWYALKNPAHISAERALAAWAYMEDSKYSLSKENLRLILDNMNTALNKSDLATVAKLTGLIESCLEIYTHDAVLLNLASVYCFLNDEKNEGIVDYVVEQKRKIWRDDMEARSFFLQFAWQFTARYSEQQQLNVHDYLEKIRPLLNDINSRLTQLKSQKKG